MKNSLLITFTVYWILFFSAASAFGSENVFETTIAPQEISDSWSRDEGETTTNPSFNQDDFETAFRQLKSQGQLQFELAAQPETPTFKWLQGLLEAIGRVLVLLYPFFIILFWGFVILMVGLLLYVIITSIRSFHVARRQKQEDDEERFTYRPAQAIILLQEVDALAAKGLYSEAVHQLLFRSIQDIGIAKPNIIRRSYTSREIAEISSLAPDTRHAFALITAEVERSYFGGRNLDKTAFDKCRAAYAELVRPQKSEESFPTLSGATA